MRETSHLGFIPLTAFMFAVLAGCGHMPVASMVKLAQVDFQTTDPEKLRVAVKLPQVLKARAEGTVLRIIVRLANGTQQARDFALIETPAERAALASEAEEGSAFTVLGLARHEVAQCALSVPR